jgi:hypothetical protein
MKPDREQIDRLGFEAWADNVIVDTIESLPPDCTGFSSHDDDMSVQITLVGKDVIGRVRAYVPGYGWKHHERTIRRACYNN